MNIVKVADYEVGQGHPLMLMAGPCVLEGYERSLMIGQRTKAICETLGIPYVFKASFDKANRTSLNGIRGMGLSAGIQAFADIKSKVGCACLTDVHEPYQCAVAGEVVDVLQIPAFLCRQTDLVVAAEPDYAIMDAIVGMEGPGGPGRRSSSRTSRPACR